MSNFDNKIVVITGGAGVLCSEMARAFAQEGASVALIGRTEASLQKVADDIVAKGGKAVSVKADVCSLDELRQARVLIHEKFGPCDVLINGAGGNHPDGITSQPFFRTAEAADDRSFFGLSADGLRHVVDLNFMGTLLPTQIFGRDMVERSGCSILNISSVAASPPLSKVVAYSAAKAAITNFTQWLAVHLAKEGIRVNALAPGFFLTEQNRTLLTNPDGSLTDRGTRILDHTPMGRFGQPQDLTGAVLWLCSDEAKFVTGIVLPVDGGFLAYGGV
jgi:NAD(P)-dependent dehydrogenase (short-subunit alcohol dehydrogenase family)